MLEERKEIIIVYTRETKVYAYQLLQLIAKNNDIKAAIREEKNYLANECQLSLDAKVIFVGKMKTVENILPNIDIKYISYGVRYGWMGNKAVIYLGNHRFVRVEYFDFLNYCSTFGMNMENLFKNPINIVSNKEIHRQQYRFVVHKFYVDGLRQFLNE